MEGPGAFEVAGFALFALLLMTQQHIRKAFSYWKTRKDAHEIACAAPGWKICYTCRAWDCLPLSVTSLWSYVLVEKDNEYRILACMTNDNPHNWFQVKPDTEYSVLRRNGEVTTIRGWYKRVPDKMCTKHLQLASGGYKAYTRLHGGNEGKVYGFIF